MVVHNSPIVGSEGGEPPSIVYKPEATSPRPSQIDRDRSESHLGADQTRVEKEEELLGPSLPPIPPPLKTRPRQSNFFP